MWLFTKYGFFSIVNADTPDGLATDVNTVMIRARVSQHLKNLQDRFSNTVLALAGVDIIDSGGTDYRYRIILSKKDWAIILYELAMEQVWGNFKDEVARHAPYEHLHSGYIAAIHDVWSVMLGLQKRKRLGMESLWKDEEIPF
jgi:hypothetical protein